MMSRIIKVRDKQIVPIGLEQRKADLICAAGLFMAAVEKLFEDHLNVYYSAPACPGAFLSV